MMVKYRDDYKAYWIYKSDMPYFFTIFVEIWKCDSGYGMIKNIRE